MKKGTKKDMGFIEKFFRLHRKYCDFIEKGGHVDKITDSISDFLDWLKWLKSPSYNEEEVTEEFKNL